MSRFALVVFALIYLAFEILVGVGVGHTARSIAVVVLFVISVPGVVFHVPLFGQVEIALFVVALLLALREPSPAAVEQEPGPLQGVRTG